MEASSDGRAKCALLVLCGLPGSGKSTLARKIREYVYQQGERLVQSGPVCTVDIVTFDDWLHPELLAGSFSAETWQRSRHAAIAHLLGLLDSKLQRFNKILDASYALLIADDNHNLRSMRYELFRAARDRGAAFLQLYVPCSVEAALARNSRRTGVAAVPAEALLRMAEALESPHPQRFAWEAASLVVRSGACDARSEDPGSTGGSNDAQQDPAPPQQQQQQQQRKQPHQLEQRMQQEDREQAALASDIDVAALCGELWRLWGPPPPPPPSEEELLRQREAGRAANAASLLHSLDLRSRRVLGTAVAAAPPSDRGCVAKVLNQERRVLLAAAREALLQLPLPQVPGAEVGPAGGGSGGHDGSGEGDGEVDTGCTAAHDVVLARLHELEAAFMSAARGTAAVGPEAEAQVGGPTASTAADGSVAT